MKSRTLCKNAPAAIQNKSYRCPKFGGDAKQTLEIRVERLRNNRKPHQRSFTTNMRTEINLLQNWEVEFT